MNYTRQFRQLGKDDILSAGGKGANLGEMVRVGFPVPPGFVLTTEAYEGFVSQHDLGQKIVDLASQVSADNPLSGENASGAIKALFLEAEMPEAIRVDLGSAYADLAPDGDMAVAVRSSATAEDKPQASFAGQQDTFLNVRGPEALQAAVKACWASLWTARALAYRERAGIDHETAAMAVVVQLMAPAEVSGILFTANPSTGARDELVVNAGYGLGEAIVSGQVTPDTFVLDREKMAVIETAMGAKELMIVPAGEQGTTSQPVLEIQRGQPALSTSLLAELAGLGVQVEEHFGGVPQDIEWAVAEDRIWLLQSRPITNLPPAPLKDVVWEPLRPGTIWMRRQIVEHMPEPLSPLFDELYLQQGLDRSMEAMAVFIGDLSGMEINVWDFVDPPFAATINGYAYSVASFNFSWSLVPIALRMYTSVLPKMIRHLIPRWQDVSLPAYRATIERWKGLDLAGESDEDLLQGIRELALEDAVYWFAAAVPLGMARTTDAALDRYLKWVAARRRGSLGPRPTSGPYLRGFPSMAMAAQVQLEAIARAINESDALREQVIKTPAPGLLDMLAAQSDGQSVLDDLQQYLEAYGHQIYDLDFVTPTLADDPLPVLLSLKTAVAHPERDTRAHLAELAQEREALVARTERSLNPLHRRIFRLLLGWAQRFTPIREEALFYVGAAWPALRRLALELGQRLAEAGSLEVPEDIFYLRTPELAIASTSRADGIGSPELVELARDRRELREARKRLDPPVVVPPDGRLKFGPIDMGMFEPKSRSASTGPVLNGFAVSPGRVSGPASIIRSPKDFDQMTPDTILVCTTTTPAWTPLFAQAKGLVTDIGGALAHGSIVAREYGIPAVMGTGVATQRIVNGQRIRVDGDAGTVTLLDEGDTGEDWLEATDSFEMPPSHGPSKKKLVAVAALAVGLAIWWKKRR